MARNKLFGGRDFLVDYSRAGNKAAEEYKKKNPPKSSSGLVEEEEAQAASREQRWKEDVQRQRDPQTGRPHAAEQEHVQLVRRRVEESRKGLREDLQGVAARALHDHCFRKAKHS